jgi:hypothetical protein
MMRVARLILGHGALPPDPRSSLPDTRTGVDWSGGARGNPIADAEAQLYRRIQELRDRARAERQASVPSTPSEHGPGTADLRTILSRAESHVGELRRDRRVAPEDPAQPRSAIEKAMDDH